MTKFAVRRRTRIRNDDTALCSQLLLAIDYSAALWRACDRQHESSRYAEGLRSCILEHVRTGENRGRRYDPAAPLPYGDDPSSAVRTRLNKIE